MSDFGLELSIADLSSLAAVAGVVPAASSPLDRAAPPDAAAHERLRAAGATDTRGALTAECLTALGVVASPSAAAAVRLAGPSPYQCAVYRRDDRAVSLSTMGGAARLRMPARADLLVAALGERIGIGDERTIDFDWWLPDGEAATLLAAIDVLRRSRLGSLAGGAPASSIIDRAALGFSRAARDTQSLLALATGLGFVRAADPSNAIPALVKRGLLIEQAGAFEAADSLVALADRLLVIERTIDVRATRGEPADGSVIVFGGVQSGSAELLVWERRSGGELHLLSLTPRRFLGLIAPLLADPSKLPTSAAASPAPTAGPSNRFCGSCGASVPAGGLFCTACGTRISAP